MGRTFQFNSSRVVHDILDGEVIAIRNDTGAYYSMAGTAAALWVLLGHGVDTTTAVALVTAHHPLTPPVTHDVVATEIDAFADQLLAHQLLLPDEGTPSSLDAPLPPETAGTPWATPEIQEFNDMADLLLFDPIHEVGPEGWPNLADGNS